MKVRIDRITKGTYLPDAKRVLRNMSFLPQYKCDMLVDDLSIKNISIIIALRGPFAGDDWDAFNRVFVYNQIPQGARGSSQPFIDTIDEDDDSEEEDSTTMQLFCIKTEARTGNKYEILVLATTKEIAMSHAVRDPAVVTSINIVPGPFTNGTVLSTRLITK